MTRSFSKADISKTSTTPRPFFHMRSAASRHLQYRIFCNTRRSMSVTSPGSTSPRATFSTMYEAARATRPLPSPKGCTPVDEPQDERGQIHGLMVAAVPDESAQLVQVAGNFLPWRWSEGGAGATHFHVTFPQLAGRLDEAVHRQGVQLTEQGRRECEPIWVSDPLSDELLLALGEASAIFTRQLAFAYVFRVLVVVVGRPAARHPVSGALLFASEEAKDRGQLRTLLRWRRSPGHAWPHHLPSSDFRRRGLPPASRAPRRSWAHAPIREESS
jgi:hypothetical protein